jgi:penicillin-binding protein 2
MIGAEDRARVRLAIIALAILMMLGVLIARLWYLQVLSGKSLALASTHNSVRIVSVEAPRGRILDRKGRVIVRNRTALAVGIRRDAMPKERGPRLAMKKRLGELLGMTIAQIDARLADRRTSPYKAVVVASDVSEEVVFTIRERQEMFPSVETLALPVRTYPRGRLAAHILGYVGETTEAELASLKGYRLGDDIGRTGIERSYEKYLRGVTGLEKLEVDAAGRVLRSLGGREAKPGNDLVLSIDIDAQKVAEQALQEGIKRARSQVFREDHRHFRAPAGATVVLDARDGGVIAMASAPTFDPRKFVGGVSDDYWAYLNDEDNHYPLLNRAVLASYPPGSTFKPFLATAALSTGTASPGAHYPCTTAFKFGDTTFHNWRPRSASITISQSLIESCDTVYYFLARNWWLKENSAVGDGRKPHEVMQEWARRFGLGSPSGIDLPQETDGRVPDRAYRRSVWEANRKEYCDTYQRTREVLFEDLCERGFLWRGGDAVNMSIGQGEVEATPLQMAVGYAAIANGGDVLTPHLARAVRTPAGKMLKEFGRSVRRKVGAKASSIAYVQRALGAVASEGTASFPYRDWPLDSIPMAAKTGSAEIGGKQPFSWFATYGPLNDPKYVVVTVVEQAGFGSQVAGPVSRRIMDELFGRRPLPIVFGTRSD